MADDREYNGLKSYDYDPKTNTINNKLGGRMKLNIDPSISGGKARNKNILPAKDTDKYRLKKIQKRIEHGEKNGLPQSDILKLKQNATKLRGKINEREKNIIDNGSIDSENPGKYSEYMTGSRKIQGISVNPKYLNNDVYIGHELGHNNSAKKKRDYYVQTGLNPNTRQPYNNNEGKEKKVRLTKEEISQLEPMELKKYFNAKPEQKQRMAIQIKNRLVDPKLKNYLDAENNARNMIHTSSGVNKHDSRPEEYLADAFALHHSKSKSSDDDLENNLSNELMNAGYSSKYAHHTAKQRVDKSRKIKNMSDRKIFEATLAVLFLKEERGILTTEEVKYNIDNLCNKYPNIEL